MKTVLTATDTESQVGDSVSGLVVTDMTVEGGAVARHQGRVVFLDEGLPGARVTAQITGQRKGVLQARVTQIEEVSAHAVAPWCPHTGTCGACVWQHFDRNAALDWKREHVRQTLARIGKCAAVDVMPVAGSPLQREYRTKMAFAFAQAADGRLLLGLRERKSKSVVDVPECGMLPPPAMDIVAFTRRFAEEHGLSAWSRGPRGEESESSRGCLKFLVLHCPVYQPDGQQQVLVECITAPDHAQGAPDAAVIRRLGSALKEAFGIQGFVHSVRKSDTDVAQGEDTQHILGSASIQERYGHLTVNVPHNTFMQTNTRAAELLYELAAREAGLSGSDVVWDVYSGVGGIALYLAQQARAVHGFELQPEAVEAARINAERLGFAHCRFHAGSLLHSLPRAPQPTVIVLDPPRAGVDKRVLEILKHSSARKIVYIACDVGTQARDASFLAPVWRAVRSFPVDMFPGTPHVENLLVFERHV